MLSNPKIRETTKYLSKPADFNRKSAVCEKETISDHRHDLVKAKQ